MSVDVDEARREAFARAGEEPSLDGMLDCYAAVFSSPQGEAVLADIISTYHERRNESVGEEVATIDHPYRAYFIEGQRSVALALRDVVAAALIKQQHGEEDDGRETE